MWPVEAEYSLSCNNLIWCAMLRNLLPELGFADVMCFIFLILVFYVVFSLTGCNMVREDDKGKGLVHMTFFIYTVIAV